jgi:hypothetical protein
MDQVQPHFSSERTTSRGEPFQGLLLERRGGIEQRTVVTRMNRRAEPAAHDVAELFTELLADKLPAMANRNDSVEAAHG